MTQTEFDTNVAMYLKRIRDASTENERMFFRERLSGFVKRHPRFTYQGKRGAMQETTTLDLHSFSVGDRVTSKATRSLGTVDRVISRRDNCSGDIVHPAGHLIVIMDDGHTLVMHPGHVEYLPEQVPNDEDKQWLEKIRVGW